jgi:hypothetical protein
MQVGQAEPARLWGSFCWAEKPCCDRDIMKDLANTTAPPPQLGGPVEKPCGTDYFKGTAWRFVHVKNENIPCSNGYLIKGEMKSYGN